MRALCFCPYTHVELTGGFFLKGIAIVAIVSLAINDEVPKSH